MSDDDDFLREINRLNVAPSLLGEVMLLWASAPAEIASDFDQKLKHVLDYVTKRDGKPGGPMLAMAVALRLMALDEIVMAPEFRGWLVAKGSRDGITLIHGDLLKVAAEQALLPGAAGDPVFDPDVFRARLMELTATRGRA